MFSAFKSKKTKEAPVVAVPDQHRPRPPPPPDMYARDRQSPAPSYSSSRPPSRAPSYSSRAEPGPVLDRSREMENDRNRAALLGAQVQDRATPNRYAEPAGQAGAWRGRRYNEDGSDKFAVSSGALQEDGEEDLEDLKSYTRDIKQDSLQSTRESLRMILETQELARGTMVALGDQSDMIADTERALDQSQAYTNRAQDKIGEIKLLNSSIFNPVAMARLNFNQDDKRRKQELKMKIRHDEEEARRIGAMTDAESSRRNLNAAMTSANKGTRASGPAGYRQQALAAKQKQRSQYQFEATASDDEIEEEMEDNLDQIGNAVGSLKLLAGAMGTEIGRQTERLTVVTQKAHDTDNVIKSTTGRMNRIK